MPLIPLPAGLTKLNVSPGWSVPAEIVTVAPLRLVSAEDNRQSRIDIHGRSADGITGHRSGGRHEVDPRIDAFGCRIADQRVVESDDRKLPG